VVNTTHLPVNGKHCTRNQALCHRAREVYVRACVPEPLCAVAAVRGSRDCGCVSCKTHPSSRSSPRTRHIRLRPCSWPCCCSSPVLQMRREAARDVGQHGAEQGGRVARVVCAARLGQLVQEPRPVELEHAHHLRVAALRLGDEGWQLAPPPLGETEEEGGRRCRADEPAYPRAASPHLGGAEGRRCRRAEQPAGAREQP